MIRIIMIGRARLETISSLGHLNIYKHFVPFSAF